MISGAQTESASVRLPAVHPQRETFIRYVGMFQYDTGGVPEERVQTAFDR